MESGIPATKSSRARRRTDVRVVPAGSTKFTLADLCQLLATAPKPDAGYRKAVKQAIRNQGKFPKSVMATLIEP